MPSTAAFQRQRRRLTVAIVAVDAVAIALAIAGTDVIRLLLRSFVGVASLNAERHLIASLLVLPVILVFFRLVGLYDLDQILAGTREYGIIVHAVTYAVFIVLTVSFFAGGAPIVSRLWLLLLWVVLITFVGVARFSIRRVVRRMRRGGRCRTRVVVVGASTLGLAIASQIVASRDEGLDVVGFLDSWLPIGEKLIGDVSVIGRPDDLVDGRLLDAADEFILVPQAIPSERLDEITRMMVARGGPTVRTAVGSCELLTNGILVAQRGNIPLVTLRRAKIVGGDAFLKRGLDLAGATLALAILGPLALVALARGVALGRRPVFKRLVVRATTGGLFTMTLLDARISSSLLIRGVPAFVDVLAGRLSLVGPRPIAKGEESKFSSRSILVVRPGITGPWRLRGSNASLDDQAIDDLAYVRSYNIWEDVRILLMTVRRTRRGVRQLGRWERPTDRRPLRAVDRREFAGDSAGQDNALARTGTH